MSKINVFEFRGREASGDRLTALLRARTQQLIQQTVDVELQELPAGHTEQRTEDGEAGVVHNGYLFERGLPTGVEPGMIIIP